MPLFATLFAIASLLGSTSQMFAQGRPDVAAQKAAMEKLSFLVGRWTGNASVTLDRGKVIQMRQTKEVAFRLDGLVLLLEGTGRVESGKVVFNALATASFDSKTSKYHLRAYHDGNYVDTELKVEPKAFEWGFASGPVTVLNRMKLDDKGRWVETTDVRMPDGREMRTVEMLLDKASGAQR